MPTHAIFQDWEEYDNRKLKATDRNFFACSEAWEVNYLVNKIRRLYPALPESEVRTAISSCCVSIPAPKPREALVRCVMRKLGKEV